MDHCSVWRNSMQIVFGAFLGRRAASGSVVPGGLAEVSSKDGFASEGILDAKVAVAVGGA